MNKKIALLLITIMSLNFSFVSSSYSEPENNEIKTIDFYDEVIKKEPNKAEYYFERANLYYENDEFEEAIKDYTKAIELEPSNSKFYTKRALLYFTLGDKNAVLKDTQKAVSLDPKNIEAYTYMSEIHSSQKKFDLVLEDYTNILNVNPELPEIISLRGNIYTLLKKYDLAMLDLNKAIELEPQKALFYRNRGMAYEKQKINELALSDYSLAIKLDSNDVDNYLVRQLYYYNHGDYFSSIKDCFSAFNLGIENDEVINTFSIQLGKNYQVLFEKKYSLEMIKDLKKIIKEFGTNKNKIALALSPLVDSKEIFFKNGLKYRALEQKEAGLISIEKSVQVMEFISEIEPKIFNKKVIASTYNAFGIVLFELNYNDKAIISLKKALLINPNDETINLSLGLFYLRQNKFDKAEEYFKKELIIQPNKFYTYYSFACLYAKKNNLKLSIKNLKKSLSLDKEKTINNAKTELDFYNIKNTKEFKFLIYK